jgi:hypothetical protein
MMKRTLVMAMLGLFAAPAVEAACLATPVPGTTITSNAGFRLHPKFKTWRPHKGVDLRARMMTPVNSAHAGKVTFSGWMGGGGNAVIIMGADGIQTRYLHLSRSKVKPGDVVSAGQNIADSGNTGEASVAPHLHFETLVHGSKVVDPRTLLCERLPEKVGAGPDRPMSGDVTSGPAPTGGTPQNPAPGTPGGLASGIPFDGYEGMGEEEILRAEVEKRFMNPEWYRQLTSSDPEAIRKEMALMQSLENFMGLMKFQSRDRFNAMLSTRMAQQVQATSTNNSPAAANAAAARN